MIADWLSYPFEVNGVKFVSKVNPASPIYTRILLTPREVFERMNQECILELVGDVSKLSKEELDKELERINEGSQFARLELV